MNAIDTNLWIYAHDTRDPAKQATAQRIIAEVEPLVLLWQVGCEFIAAARKLEPFGFSQADAWSALEDMQEMSESVLMPDPGVWTLARDVQRSHRFSFWDSLIIAACVLSGVKSLYSEDRHSSRPIEGLSLVNPFSH